MYKIGITGGIGSGKSTVCQMLRERGVAVYESDSWAKKLMQESDAIRQQIIATFGAESYNEQGLDRAFLARCVFGDAEALQRLNAIVHPAVREDFHKWCEEQRSPYVVLESAILFEAAFENEVDATLAVLAPLELRVQRTMQRDGVTREQVMQRIDHQMSDDELHARAHRTLVNMRQDYLESDVEQLHKMFLYEAQSH